MALLVGALIGDRHQSSSRKSHLDEEIKMDSFLHGSIRKLTATLGRGVALSFGLAIACATSASEPSTVEIRFDAVVGPKPFACGQTYSNIGTTHSEITPTDLRFFVSGVSLQRADGTTVPVNLDQDQLWQYRDITLLDFEDGTGPCRNGTPATNRSIRGSVPAGEYHGLTFTLGVPFDLNHGDATIAPSPLNLTAMFWIWNAGYKFLKLDMSTSGLPDKRLDAPAGKSERGRPVGFPVHIGSSGCTPGTKTQPPAACKAPNRVTVSLPSFDPRTDRVVMDVAALLQDANVDANTPNTAPGCMSEPNDPDCKAVFEAIGLGSKAQQFFTVGKEPRR